MSMEFLEKLNREFEDREKIEITEDIIKELAKIQRDLSLMHESIMDNKQEKAELFYHSVYKNYVPIYEKLERLSYIFNKEKDDLICSKKDIYFDEIEVKKYYSITSEGVVIHIKMPLLRNKNSDYKGSSSYIVDNIERSLSSEIIYELAKDFINKNDLDTPLFSPAAIVFIHEFGKEIPFGLVHDFDNVRTKDILDSIGMLFIQNDNALEIATLSLGKRSEMSATNLYIMPKSHLAEWLKKAPL